MKERFIEKRFNSSSVVIIAQANTIISEYQDKGFTLTLRQLYYQFISRDLLPANTVQQYKRLGSIINDARLAGLVDWNSIEDRTRNLASPASWDDPEQILAAVASQYAEDAWATQKYRPEVWIEKEALVGVIEGVCGRLRVPYFACRGYASQSEVYQAGKRLSAYRRSKQTPIIFHLGDHDPSGIDMTRDNDERLAMFAREGIEVRRLALNMPQIEEYNPPPNPAKETDSRFAGYLAKHGDESWELDALDPELIASLIENAVKTVIDQDAWDAAIIEEEYNKTLLQETSDNWEDVKARLRDIRDGMEG